MAMIGVALIISAITATAAGLVAAWAKYCGHCDANKILEYVGLRSVAEKSPESPVNKDEEKAPIANTEKAIPSYQVSV